jgi:hypothetical protein
MDGQLEALDAADVVVVDAAERLSASNAALLLESLSDGRLSRLVLLGDPDELDGAAGRFFGDVVDSGVVPVCTLRDVRQTAPLNVLGSALRAGRLPVLDPSERSVVVTPAADPDQALRSRRTAAEHVSPTCLRSDARRHPAGDPPYEGQMRRRRAQCRRRRRGASGHPGGDLQRVM